MRLWGIILALLVIMPYQTFGEPLEEIGQVSLLEGTAKVLREEKELSLHLHDVLYAGDVIVTAFDGSVDITMRDTSKFSMGPKTRLRLVQLQIRPVKREETRRTHAEIERGKVVVKTGGAQLLVTTPTSTIRAKNTQFAVEVK